MKSVLRSIGLSVINLFGSTIRDARTGKSVGRALLIPWKGKIHVIGLDIPVACEFEPQKSLRYWNQSIRFFVHDILDEDRLPPNPAPAAAATHDIFTVLLTHQSPSAIEKMLQHWSQFHDLNRILICFNGAESEFSKIQHPRKIRIIDERLATKDHQAELQSYSKVFAAISAELANDSWERIHFLEFDHYPLRRDLYVQIEAHRTAEDADVLFHGLGRVDGTNRPHFLYHLTRTKLVKELSELSERQKGRTDPIVISALGSGSYWTKQAFIECARGLQKVDGYLELTIPSVAHHLGFRVRPFPLLQDEFATAGDDRTSDLPAAKQSNAWLLHPAKRLWD